MPDLGSGVFVSRVDSDEFEPDDDAGGHVHMLFDDGGAMAGIWKPEPDLRREYRQGEAPARETVVVLSGSARVEIRDGPTLDLSVGDMASLPKGAVATWYPSVDFKKVWVYS